MNVLAGLLFFIALVIACILLSDTLTMSKYFNCIQCILTKYKTQIEILEETNDLFKALSERKIPFVIMKKEFFSKLDGIITETELIDFENARTAILMNEVASRSKSSTLKAMKEPKYIYFRKNPFENHKYATSIMMVLVVVLLVGSFYTYNESRKLKLAELNQVGIPSFEDRFISIEKEDTIQGKAIFREYDNGWFNDHYYLHVLIEEPINETLRVEVPSITYENFKKNETVFLYVQYSAVTDLLKQETEYTFNKYSLQ